MQNSSRKSHLYALEQFLFLIMRKLMKNHEPNNSFHSYCAQKWGWELAPGKLYEVASSRRSESVCLQSKMYLISSLIFIKF